MSITTDISYDVDEEVLKQWLAALFGSQFGRKGTVVWTYSVSHLHSPAHTQPHKLSPDLENAHTDANSKS